MKSWLWRRENLLALKKITNIPHSYHNMFKLLTIYSVIGIFYVSAPIAPIPLREQEGVSSAKSKSQEEYFL